MNHILPLNNNSFVKTSLSYSGTGVDDDIYESDTVKKYNNEGEFLSDSISSKTHVI